MSSPVKSINCLLFLFALAMIGCQESAPSSQPSEPAQLNSNAPFVTFQPEHLFPGDGSLLRAEDGVALPDGRVIVVDQAHGLKIVESSGENRSFGDFSAAGFVHDPPETIAGPNGVVLEPEGTHLLLADVFDGKLYRIDIQTEEVDMFYDHPYGINTLYRDRTGAIWFTQSTNNTNMEELFRDVNLPVPTGAVYRMADLDSEPVRMVDSLYFANGITMDPSESQLFVAETMMDRVHVFDVQRGSLSNGEVAVNIPTPDNIMIDPDGRLVAALPAFNQVVAVDFTQRNIQVLFDGSTPSNRKVTQEWVRRSHLGMELLELLGPDLFAPLPGVVTGMFFSDDYTTLYITNLGNDLIKYDWPPGK